MFERFLVFLYAPLPYFDRRFSVSLKKKPTVERPCCTPATACSSRSPSLRR